MYINKDIKALVYKKKILNTSTYIYIYKAMKHILYE